MNAQQIAAMTDQEINIAVARHTGWTHLPPNTVQYTARRPDGKWDTIPDYANDLNAMRTVEEWMGSEPMLADYLNALDDSDHLVGNTAWVSSTLASARQRAEAFLRTVAARAQPHDPA